MVHILEILLRKTMLAVKEATYALRFVTEKITVGGKMNLLMKSLLTGLILLSQLSLGEATESKRCESYQDSLSNEEALLRTQWAFKCYPYLRATMKDKRVNLVDVDSGTMRLGYPIFGKFDDNGNLLEKWKAPLDPNASCDPAQTYQFAGFCVASCYTPDQLVLYSDGYTPISQAKETLRQDIMTLAQGSTLEKISLVPNILKSYTVDQAPREQDILIIETEGGGRLSVTTNHPLVLGIGVVRSAGELKIGDQLITQDGEKDPVTKITPKKYFGKVINVQMSNYNITDNIVVAQGYLNGSVFFQNADIKKVNRRVLRELVPSKFND